MPVFLSAIFWAKSTLWGTIAEKNYFLIYKHIKNNTKKGEVYHAILVKNHLKACSDR